VPDGDVVGPAGLEREGQPDKPGPGRGGTVGLGVQGQVAGRGHPGGQGLELGLLEDRMEGLFGRPAGLLQEFGQERGELEFAEKADGLGLVRLLEGEAGEIELDVQPPLHRDQPAAEVEDLPVGHDPLPDAGVLDPVEVPEQGLEGAEFLDEGLGRLFADPGHAGDVVRGVAPEGQDIDDLAGRDPEEVLDVGLADLGLFRRVPDGRRRVDDLEEVLVGRDDDRADVPGRRARGQGRQDVVGFVLRVFGRGDAEGPEDVLEDGHLDGQVLGHRLALGFVIDEGLVADGRALDVEDDPGVLRLLPVQDLAQGAEEAVHGARGEARRVGQALDGVVGAVEQGVAVDEDEAFRAQSNLPSTISSRILLCWSSIISSTRSPRSAASR
jgi:hypothetical protein